jgi:hypothetical protein
MLLTAVLLSPTSDTAFYLFFSWLLVYLRSPEVGVPVQDTLGPLLLGMVAYNIAVLIGGRFLCDGRTPKLWSLLGFNIAAIALVPPALLWGGRGSAVARWVVVPVAIFVSGLAFSLSRCAQLSLMSG